MTQCVVVRKKQETIACLPLGVFTALSVPLPLRPFPCYLQLSNKSTALHCRLLKKCFLSFIIKSWFSYESPDHYPFRATSEVPPSLRGAGPPPDGVGPFPAAPHPHPNNFQTSGSCPFSSGASAPSDVSAELQTHVPTRRDGLHPVLRRHLRGGLSNTGVFLPFPSCLSFLVPHPASSSGGI